MLRLIGLAVSVGLADSLNPTTIAPALYLASGDRARANVTEFTLGVFFVYLVGGIAIALGPGQLLLALIPKPGPETSHVIETIVGAVLITGSMMLWRHRDRLSERRLPQPKAEGRSSAILGATITALELPTAFPYFAVIAATVAADVDAARQILILVIFNLCFVAPLLGIVATLTFAGSHADRLLAIGRNFLQRNWPLLLSGLLFLAGLFVVLLGITGLTSTGPGRFHRFMRHFRHLLHP